jgi:iron complex transport system ATP-binding protein
VLQTSTMTQIEPVIHLHHVSVRRAGRTTVDDVSLTIRQGEHWALIGPNGAGKSTLMGLCSTVSQASSGIVEIFGQQVGTVETTSLTRRMGYVTNHHRIEWPLTSRDIVLTAFTNSLETPMRWVATAQQIARADVQLEKFGLGQVKESLWQHLSQGELARCFLARAVLLKPEILLLDEPAAGLDLAAREQVLDLIDELSTERPELAVLLITHHLEELPTSTTHAALVRDGKIVHTGLADAVLTSANVSETFGVAVTVEYRHKRWHTRSTRD